LEVRSVMQFITLVQLRPGSAAGETGSQVAAQAAQWQHLQNQIQLVGGRVNQIWNVLGNDYDLMFLGEADDPKTLHRIDVVCKGEGYASKTHPAIEAAEYAQLVQDTAEILTYGGRQRQRQDVERDEA
jgi:uncharacterized protein with GYD domain